MSSVPTPVQYSDSIFGKILAKYPDDSLPSPSPKWAAYPPATVLPLLTPKQPAYPPGTNSVAAMTIKIRGLLKDYHKVRESREQVEPQGELEPALSESSKKRKR